MFFFARLYQNLSKEKSQKPLRFLAFLENSALRELGSTSRSFETVFLIGSKFPQKHYYLTIIPIKPIHLYGEWAFSYVLTVIQVI